MSHHNCAICGAGLLIDEPLGRCKRCGALFCESCHAEYCAMCDERRWIPTFAGRDSYLNYGGLNGDLRARLVAVAGGRWMALPMLCASEMREFIGRLMDFAAANAIRLSIWRHPLHDRTPGCFASLVCSTDSPGHVTLSDEGLWGNRDWMIYNDHLIPLNKERAA